MSNDPTAVLEPLARLQEIHAGTPHEAIVANLIAALAADTTAADLRQEVAFRDAEIEPLEDTTRRALDALVAERDRYREALGGIAAEPNPVDYECQRIAQEALTYRSYFDGSHRD